jgi:hypothetical protein
MTDKAKAPPPPEPRERSLMEKFADLTRRVVAVPKLEALASKWLVPDALLSSRDYEGAGLTSKPEWGLNLSVKNQELLDRLQFDSQILKLQLS